VLLGRLVLQYWMTLPWPSRTPRRTPAFAQRRRSDAYCGLHVFRVEPLGSIASAQFRRAEQVEGVLLELVEAVSKRFGRVESGAPGYSTPQQRFAPLQGVATPVAA